jgi:putative acetyltransferase
MPTLDELRERVDLEFAAGWSATVAVRDDDVIGFVAIKPNEAVLDQLFVRPGSIGGGVGQALLAHSKTVMPKGFTLFTRSANTKARRFYEKSGLIFLRNDKHPRTGDPVTYYGWNIA